MERMAVAGCSLSEVRAADLDRLARPGSAALRGIADDLGASELVLLATCNRVEIVYAREAGHPPEEADRRIVAAGLGADDGEAPDLRWLGGDGAVRHLFRVASGLDSLVLGDQQIPAQVREAWDTARGSGMTGSILDPVFEAALGCARRVAADTGVGRLPVSLVSLALDAVAETRSGASGSPPIVGIVGAGLMARRLARAAASNGLAPTWVANRSLEAAETLAAEFGATAVTLEALRAGGLRADVMLVATSALEPILDRAELERLDHAAPGGRLVAVDLGAPRNLEPGPAGVAIIDLESLRASADANRAARRQAAAAAEAVVADRLEAFARRRAEARIADVAEELRGVSADLLESEIAALSDGRLADLTPAHRAAVERWARSAFGRLQHLPARAMKDLASELAAREEAPL